MFKKGEKGIVVSLKIAKEDAGGVGVFSYLMSIGRNYLNMDFPAL